MSRSTDRKEWGQGNRSDDGGLTVVCGRTKSEEIETKVSRERERVVGAAVKRKDMASKARV